MHILCSVLPPSLTSASGGPRSYALTVHKAQGSEYPVVVLPLTWENGRMLHRSLLSRRAKSGKRTPRGCWSSFFSY